MDGVRRDDQVLTTPGTAVWEALCARARRDFAGAATEPARPRIDGLLVLHWDATVFEAYFGGMAADRPHIISSCTKSITALLAGIALDQGLFGLDDRVVDHFPGVAASATWDGVLARHLLSMTAGVDHTPAVAQELLVAADVEAFVLQQPLARAPGTQYLYDNCLPVLVGRMVQRRSSTWAKTPRPGQTAPEFGIVECVADALRAVVSE